MYTAIEKQELEELENHLQSVLDGHNSISSLQEVYKDKMLKYPDNIE